MSMLPYIVSYQYDDPKSMCPKTVSVIVHTSLEDAPEAAKKILRTRPSSFKLNGPYSNFSSKELTVEEIEQYVFPNLLYVKTFTGVISFSALDG